MDKVVHKVVLDGGQATFNFIKFEFLCPFQPSGKAPGSGCTEPDT